MADAVSGEVTYLCDSSGRKTGVILTPSRYEQLLECERILSSMGKLPDQQKQSPELSQEQGQEQDPAPAQTQTQTQTQAHDQIQSLSSEDDAPEESHSAGSALAINRKQRATAPEDSTSPSTKPDSRTSTEPMAPGNASGSPSAAALARTGSKSQRVHPSGDIPATTRAPAPASVTDSAPAPVTASAPATAPAPVTATAPVESPAGARAGATAGGDRRSPADPASAAHASTGGAVSGTPASPGSDASGSATFTSSTASSSPSSRAASASDRNDLSGDSARKKKKARQESQDPGSGSFDLFADGNDAPGTGEPTPEESVTLEESSPAHGEDAAPVSAAITTPKADPARVAGTMIGAGAPAGTAASPETSSPSSSSPVSPVDVHPESGSGSGDRSAVPEKKQSSINEAALEAGGKEDTKDRRTATLTARDRSEDTASAGGTGGSAKPAAEHISGGDQEREKSPAPAATAPSGSGKDASNSTAEIQDPDRPKPARGGKKDKTTPESRSLKGKGRSKAEDRDEADLGSRADPAADTGNNNPIRKPVSDPAGAEDKTEGGSMSPAQPEDGSPAPAPQAPSRKKADSRKLAEAFSFPSSATRKFLRRKGSEETEIHMRGTQEEIIRNYRLESLSLNGRKHVIFTFTTSLTAGDTQKKYEASGYYPDSSSNAFVVLKGSWATADCAKSFRDRIDGELKKLISEEKLQLQNGRYLFTADVEFNSPSIAASMVAGNNRSGTEAWRASNGMKLKHIAILPDPADQIHGAGN